MTPFPRPDTVPAAWRAAPLGPLAHRFVRTQRFDRPLEHVAAFFADAGHLERIAPRWLDLQYVSDRDTPIVPDARIDYRVRMFGLPFVWRTRILHSEPTTLAYEQEIGPCAAWRHLYDYVADGHSTILIDSVEYALPWGPAGRLARRVFARRVIHRMFDVRASRLADLVSS